MKLTIVVFTLFFFLVNPVVLNSSNNKEMLRNISTLGYETDESGKSWIDTKTRYKISTCSESYDLIKQLGINVNKNEPACAKTDYYEGSCWVTNLGFTGGNYKAEVCYQPPLGYAQCKVLSSGESSGKFSLEMRDLSYTNPYYTGNFKTKDDQECPDYTNNINALGYVYIKEATDAQYANATDFASKFCQPLSEKYNSNNCSPPQTCPCDDEECRANNFIPPKTSEVWKNSTQKAKNCYLCLQQYRAVNFYCNKIYQCLNKDRKSYAYELAKSDYRKYIDDMYGEGVYLCGYYDGKLCGCGKSKLSAGPRHFLRVARKTSSKCESKEDLIANPQCNLFKENIYARQFYNDYVNHTDSDCPFKSPPELGYKKRGTFFSPKITIVSGKNERLIGYNSSLLLGNEEYYYNRPIGESIEYSENNRYNFPTAKKILFSNFYPVIFTIGGLDEVKDKSGKCLQRASGDISYVMLRLEYNFSTSESALVAYKVRFLNDSPSQLIDGKSLLSDGSISRFIVNDDTFINAIKNAKITSDKETMDELEFKYDFDPNQNFEKNKMQENGKYLYFENIGKVVRPPLKYSYDEGSIYINTPIVLEEDLSVNPNANDTREKRLKISLIPSKLSSFEGDEFEYDKQLAPIVKQVSLAGYSKEAFNLSSDDVITNKSTAGITSDTIMYMKRFSVKYNNSCVFLKAMNDPGQEEYLLTNPPYNITECSNISSLEKKMACIVSFISLYECNGYVNCLDKAKSISECQSENRRPKIKLLGSDSDLPEYKKNIDFRSYTQSCVDEGFEFADKLSDYSNTKLFGDFGYAPYDYTIRWKKKDTGISSSTPGRPLSIRYSDSINQPEEYQDKPKDIITMDIDYFYSLKSDRSTNMMERLNGVYMINTANGMPSNITAYQQYASDCGYNTNICKDRYEVKHRLVSETLGTLCVSSGNFNNGEWDLKSRDFGIDYNIYVPLRCQYVFFSGVGAGGAGFTTEKNSNCLVQYWVTESAWYLSPFPTPGFFSPAYLRTPKFDATGSQGGSVTAKINLNSFPVFDGYLSVTAGSRTLFSRSQIDGKSDDDPEKCFIGARPNHNIDRNTGDWMVRGGTHGFWFLNYNSLIKTSNNKAYLDNPPKPNISDVEKYYDYRKGNSEIAFDTHGANVSSFNEKEYINSIYEIEKQKLEALLDVDRFISLIKEDKKYRLIEFYLVALMHLSYRLQYADNALLEAQKIALAEIRKKYEAELLEQKENKKSKENEKIVLQSQLDGMSADIDECENIDPSTGRTISGKTQEECNEINRTADEIMSQIRQLDADILAIQQEIDRLEIIINHNDYPDDEIRNFDISTSVMKDSFTSIINSINNNIDNEKKSWTSEIYPSETRAILNENSEIKDLENNYKTTNVEKLNEVIDRYIESIRSVSNEKKLYCNNLSNITATNIIDIENIKRFYEEQFIDVMTNHLDLFNELQEEKRLIKELYLSCKEHTNNLIELSTIKPEKYADKIEFRHSNDYGLLKSLMCLSLDINGSDCEEQNSIKSHNKIQNSSNLCEATKILKFYNDAKEKLYQNISTNKETICYRTDCRTEEDEDGNERTICGEDDEDDDEDEDSDDCKEGDDNCECMEIEYSETERITDKYINLNSKSISDMLEIIQKQISVVKGLEDQLEEIDEAGSSTTDSNYQYLATALRGSSPIDARIRRKRQGKDNVPYWDGEHTLTGTTTSFQANLAGKTIDGRKCYRTGLYDIAYKHDYICLHKKGWIEGKRKVVINDGYGYANKDYTFSDAFSNERSLERSSTLSTELDHRAMLGSYEKYEGMSGDGSGSVNDHSAVKGKWNLYNENEREGAGGSFHHLQGAGGGGPGSVTVNVTSIGVEQFEYNGETYPKLNDDGTKKVIAGDHPDKKCIIKCPPMNVFIKDFEFYFPEIQKTAPIDMVCEYSGEPENDMEIVIGTTATPKKCYIVTESVSGVGDVKGKIIISSDGVCPIAKCEYESWGTSAQPNALKSVAQYDRNTGICKPRDQYGDEKKSSKYFMMMFDKNVYSGLAYMGSRTSTLSASIPQYIDGKWKFNSYTIARCSNTKIDGYIIDTYDQLSTLGKKCSDSGFWSENNSVSVEPLFEKREYDASCMPSKNKYETCKINDNSDEERKKEYNSNNSLFGTKEYIVKNFNYILGKKNGNEFGQPKDGDVVVSGIHNIDKKNIKIGRTVFKNRIKCPMLDADRYDFDKDYTGNAIWDFADEHNDIVTAIRCKKNAIQIGNSLPTRACKVNGLWGPIMINSCLVACDEKIENGIRWVVTSDDIKKVEEDKTVKIYGACSGNYLNSQEYRNTDETAWRICNLTNSTWGTIHGIDQCKDGLICINDNYDKKIVSTPYARTLIFTKSNQYKELINELNNSGNSKLAEKTEYKDGLYLSFENGKKYSSVFGSHYYQANNDHIDVKIEEKNFDVDGSSYITDNNGHRLVDRLSNNDYYVISVYNTIYPDAFSYMTAKGKDERNEFLNIENWLSILKENKMNFTGQWKWKANLSIAKSKTVEDSTKQSAQEIYKNARLYIFIPKLIDNNRNLKHIALFSPYLAKSMGADSSIVPAEDESIKFRYMLDISDDYLIANEPYAMTVYDGISSSSRLYRFEWDKGDNDDWGHFIQTTHKIGSRNCNGKYFGFIKHNTTKHIMYTPEPTSSNQLFASLYCYDGRIFGFHAFRSKILQDETLTDDNTKNVLLATDANGYNGARTSYEFMKSYFDTLDLDNDYFSDDFDNYREGAKNAYLFAMMAKYWQAHIMPTEEEQSNFIEHYRPNEDIDYRSAENEGVRNVLKRYSEGNLGYYYRVLPRRVDWINGTKSVVVDSIINIYDIAKIDDEDPYCLNTKCIQQWKMSDNLNKIVNENSWKQCDETITDDN